MENEKATMRQAIALAKEAMANGDHPFGALLVKDGEVVLTAVNTIHSDNDITRHAELNLVSQASRQFTPEFLAACTLVTSTEPCAMCAGAIYWAGISKVVFGCSAITLREIAGDEFLIPCEEIFARSPRPFTVIGPLLEEESTAVHQQYWPHLP
ncbi:MAG: tRNA-specific adenosine deaminase [Ardenticatenaceae bacterium]|nr:MAG: tRNA-specific adenosine deaminase [Ardenticatenaceae bacterium]